jgi:hypothetical protein
MFVLFCLALSLFMATGPIYRAWKFYQTPEDFRMEILPSEDAEQAIQQP